MDQRYPRLYRRLKTMGHCAAKTVEILLDAHRGDRYAIAWCRMAARTTFTA